jgi:2-haloacid dehalogenase
MATDTLACKVNDAVIVRAGARASAVLRRSATLRRGLDQMACSIYAFDAYGTLFDVHAAVRRHAAALGPDAPAFSALWRAKQLEYSWVRSMAGRYADFWTLTEQALDFAFSAFPSADRSLRTVLLDAYRKLDCYPEVPEVIRGLKKLGKQLAILSNGTPRMLASAVSAAGLDGCFDTVLSVDAVRAYKTDSRVYDLLATHFRVYPQAISFQSSNRWDIAGAAAFGLRTVWINRAGAADEYADMPPAAVLPTLDGLLRLD